MFEGKIYNVWEHRGGGNSIQLDLPKIIDQRTGSSGIDLKNCKCNGWLSQRPRDGDILRVNMKSGRIYRFYFRNIEIVNDPDDMFFANLEAIGYE